ncbi:MAG: TIM-barrel domain-containing protein, partial [Polyangiales bacterium]
MMRRTLSLTLSSSLLVTAGCSSTDDPANVPDSGADVATDTDPCTFTGAAEPDLEVPKLHTPRWAFLPWISKDISTRDDTYAFVKGFEDRDIPVGVVVLDSPWESNYNTFVPSPTRYPEFGKMVSDLKAKNIRVVLWVTQMTNENSFDLEEGGDHYDGEAANYLEGLACGFYLNDGERFAWWKGSGGAVDFFNGRARGWWHAQQNLVLDLGISGWKLDFGESYVRADPVKTAIGPVPHQQYSEKYYQDYLSYGVKRRGKEDFVTMVRPWDESYDFKGRFFARKEHAPVAWVGDNRRDWLGLKDALNETLISAKAGYVVVGSDVGGYLDRDDVNITIKVPADTMTFARWTATSALLPFMQLHGRANLTPWTVPDHADETAKLYRFWSKLHAAMVPFFYS